MSWQDGPLPPFPSQETVLSDLQGLHSTQKSTAYQQKAGLSLGHVDWQQFCGMLSPQSFNYSGKMTDVPSPEEAGLGGPFQEKQSTNCH